MSDIKIDVRVYPIDEPKGTTKAFASIGSNDLIAIRGVRVVEGSKGLFTTMPQFKTKDDTYQDIAFPLTGDLRKQISAVVLNEFDRMMQLTPEQRSKESQNLSRADEKNIQDVSLDIRVYVLDKPDGNTKALASVSVDGLVAIRGVRVVESEKGAFVSMPQSKDSTGGYHDIAFPLNGDLRKAITKAVLDNYNSSEIAAEHKLANGLRDGAAKAAKHTAVQKDATRPRTGVRA